MDVELGSFEQSQPLGFIAPADGAFAHEIAEFVQARIARDAEEESAAGAASKATLH
jgi:hypothetical protein